MLYGEMVAVFCLFGTLYQTAVELFGLALPRLCARNDAPTGSRDGTWGWEFNALNVAAIAPWNKELRNVYHIVQILVKKKSLGKALTSSLVPVVVVIIIN